MTDKPTIMTLTPKESPTWCPGCGDFTILGALKSALVELGIAQKDVVISSGIGCGSKTPHFINTYGFEGLHGRSLAVATGIKLANNKLTVIGIAGDGDTYGIGGNHFMHAMRRNLDITMIVQDNAVYGLTKGQTSPTSRHGFISNSTPFGALEEPVNPMTWGIAAGATFLARGYSVEMNHLKDVLVEAVRHKGFSLVDVLQPCTTYNKINTAEWYKQRVYKLDASYNSKDKLGAIAKAEEWGDHIPLGVFYKEDRPTYEDGLPVIKDTPLAKQDISNVNIDPFLSRYS